MAAAVGADLHHRADELGGNDDVDVRDRLEVLGDHGSVGQFARRADFLLLAVRHLDAVAHRRRRLHEVDVLFAFEALLDDFHVQQAEEATAEAEAERVARLGLERERAVVEPQLLQRLAQVLELARNRGIEAAEHHRLRLAEARQRLAAQPLVLVRHRVADDDVLQLLDVGDDVADLARVQLFHCLHVGLELADFHDLVVGHGAAHADHLGLLDRAVEHAHVDHDAAVVVVDRVEDQRLQVALRVAGRRRDLGHDRFEHLLDVLAGLGRDRDRVLGGDADCVLDLGRDLLGSRVRQVHLVEDREHRQLGLLREVRVHDRLRLDALRRVDQQQGAFARLQRLEHLVVEVDVPGRVDQVELVGLPVVGLVVHGHGARLDRDAALALELHVVEELRLHLPLLDGSGQLDQAVGERGLPVVHVGDDAEVADQAGVGHGWVRMRSGGAGRRQSPDARQGMPASRGRTG